MTRKPTHIATICKLVKTFTPSADKLVVCVPLKVKEGTMMASKKFTDADGTTFLPAYEAFTKGEKTAYILDVSYDDIVNRGRKVLEANLNYDYDKDSIHDKELIIDDYRTEYANDLNNMTWFFDLGELVPTITGCSNEEFFEIYDMSIDRKRKSVTAKPPTNPGKKDPSEDELEEDIDNTSEVKENKKEATPKVKFTRIGLINEMKKYIIAQDDVIETVVSAVYKPIVLGQPKKIRNVLLYGPTGCGKTYILETLAKLLDIPYYYSSVANFSATGYVGSSVEDLYVGLYKAAGSDLKRLEKGAILFIDEIDKLLMDEGGSGNVKTQVFDELLPVYQHGGTVTFKPNMYSLPITYNKENLIIFTGGSFSKLEVLESHLGFGASYKKPPIRKFYTKDDFEKKLHIHREWLGRQDLCYPLNMLTAQNFYEILTAADDSPYLVDLETMKQHGIHMNISENALRKIAEKAYQLNTGARALRGTYEFALEKASDDIVDRIESGEDLNGKSWDISDEEVVKRLGEYYG